MVIRRCASLFFLFFCLSFPLQAAPFYRINNTQHRFSIEIPSDWSLWPQTEAALLAYSPFTARLEGYTPSFNVIVQDAPDVSLDVLFDANIDYATRVLPQFRMLKLQEVEIAGVEALQLVYSCRLSVQNRLIQLRNTAYFLLFNQRLYLLTYSALQQEWDEYQELFEYMVQTLRLF